MSESVQSADRRRDRVLKAALDELARFEQQEREFRKKDRKERAAELRLPVDSGSVH